ncbi:F23F12.8 [Symbiodinium sp. CCMP2592]|nr:F23F12.8 [Symbiodinium sp. CCMP2592]
MSWYPPQAAPGAKASWAMLRLNIERSKTRPVCHEVLMRNFPKSWVAEGEPEIFDGGFDVSAVTAIACFETIEAAQAAVQTLSGADMRTNTEKKAAGNKPPLDSERFWAQLKAAPSSASSAWMPRRGAKERFLGTDSYSSYSNTGRESRRKKGSERRSPKGQTLRALTSWRNRGASEESYILVRGFPPSWREPQVKYLFVVFGGTSSVIFVPDPEFGRAAQVTLKDAAALGRAASSLNETDEMVAHLDGKLGQMLTGDMIEECHILCSHGA